MFRFLAVFLLIASSVLALAQASGAISAELGLPKDGEFLVWTHKEGEPSTLSKVEAGEKGWTVSGDKGTMVVVVSTATGRAATKPIEKAKGWSPLEIEFTRHGQLSVVVTHEGKLVESGVLRVSFGKESQSLLMTPEDKGKVTLRNVPRAEASITVTYKTAGEEKKTSPVKVSPPVSGDWVASVAIPDPVATIDPAAAKGEATGDAPKAAEAKPVSGDRNPLSSILNLLIGAALLGGIGYGVYRYFQGKPEQAVELLQKAGINPNPQPDDPPAPNIPAPKPLQTIVLDDASPHVPAPAMAAAAPLLQPKLMFEDSRMVPLLDGESMVGRETGLAIELSPETGASRNHAALRREGDRVWIRDLGSTNGTYVNGARISGETELRPGDILIFGQARCRFEV